MVACQIVVRMDTNDPEFREGMSYIFSVAISPKLYKDVPADALVERYRKCVNFLEPLHGMEIGFVRKNLEDSQITFEDLKAIELVIAILFSMTRKYGLIFREY